MRSVFATIALFCSASTFAGTTEELTADEFKNLGEHYGRCAGLWLLFSEVDSINEKTAAAEQTHGLELGALTAATWAFAMRYQKLNPTLSPKPLGHFMDRAKSLRDLERTRLLALLENDGSEDFQKHVQLCQMLREGQQDILDSLRDQHERGE